MSKMFQGLSMIAVLGVAVVGASLPAAAGNLPARGGKSDWPVSEPGCWGVSGPTVQNNCSTAKFWYMPLVNVFGSFWVNITAQAASNTSNVECAVTSASRDGVITSSGWLPLPQFGVARDISLVANVPIDGTAMADCKVLPGGKLHTLHW